MWHRSDLKIGLLDTLHPEIPLTRMGFRGHPPLVSSSPYLTQSPSTSSPCSVPLLLTDLFFLPSFLPPASQEKHHLKFENLVLSLVAEMFLSSNHTKEITQAFFSPVALNYSKGKRNGAIVINNPTTLAGHCF